jgi:hypothetical protein
LPEKGMAVLFRKEREKPPCPAPKDFRTNMEYGTNEHIIYTTWHMELYFYT